MSALFLILGLMAGGGAAWWMARGVEEERHASRIRELESKIRYSQGEMVTLREQLNTARAQVGVMEKNITQERAQHTTALTAMAASLKKGILALTAAYFTIGLVCGGTAGWFGASWRGTASETGERLRLEMNARLSELKVELLQKQLDQLEKSSSFFEIALREERVARAVALTKLQILLESVMPQKTGGFMLDEQKLKKNLKDKIDLETRQDLPLLQSTPRL